MGSSQSSGVAGTDDSTVNSPTRSVDGPTSEEDIAAQFESGHELPSPSVSERHSHLGIGVSHRRSKESAK